MNMRAAIVLCALLATFRGQSADARFVMLPTIMRACPGAPSWAKVEACLLRHGTVRVLKSEAKVRLVELTQDAKKSTGFRVPGMYLYTQVGKQWRLGGTLDGEGYKLVAFGRVAGIKHQMFRIDVSRARDDTVAIGARAHDARLRYTVALFCNGHDPGCSSALTSCDVYVDGKSYFTFRGTLKLVDDRTMSVDGDRSNAGDRCLQAEELFLPVPFDAADDI
jgi:uncharacterized protein (DUF736 family)